jgi:two-component system CheB/CheR fusion protein
MAAKKAKAGVKKIVESEKPPVKNDATEKTAEKHRDDFPIVGIGASAGGLEAIEGFISHTPSDIGLAFVIVQHLPPEHKSIMASLLNRQTEMKVLEIKDGMKVERNCVYLNPPSKDISIMNRRLYLLEPPQPRGVHLPIDVFFRSLAECAGDKSICIVLSGTGTDGTLGLKAIKGAGGTAMAQAESQARYPNMPRSAIDTGLVDFVLPVEKMADELAKYVKHPYIGGPERAPTEKEKFETSMQKIFMLVRSVTGQDFSHYKQNTTRRRIERRMAVHQITNIGDYVRYLQTNPAEARTLSKDFSITVTNFFRDPQAFEALADKVILPMLKERPKDSNIRVWVPGCATGEEAYSIAILFAEVMDELKKPFNLQIFATDIDADAIDLARQGVYPDSIAADVSADRLKHFFIKEGSTYQIRKPVREMVVFAIQNLIKDSPFSRLDLVCCRNLLIYMDSMLQKKILPLFHYTLNPGGFLFLGTSESTGEFSGLFSPVDAKWKIFKRSYSSAEPAIERPITPFYDITGKVLEKGKKALPTAFDVRQMAERMMLQNYAPPCVLVDDKFDILYFNGATDKFLTLPRGEPSFNILKMAPDDLRYQLNTMLRKAAKEKKAVTAEGLKLRHDNEINTVNLVVRPFTDYPGMEHFLMVTFESGKQTGKTVQKKTAAGKSSDPRVTTLQQELASTKEYLQTTVEELETSNEELKSTNEELQSTNEELQSTNEELGTSREELQSTNKELETVNAELRGKVEQLSNVNNDLNNLLSSTEIATLFLDGDLKIKRFTPKTTEVFKLINSDVGRPISDIVHNLKYDRLIEDVRSVLGTFEKVEKTVQLRDGRWFAMRILPYRTVEDVIDGVVIIFVDISTRNLVQLASKEVLTYTTAVLQTVRSPLIVLDDKFRVVFANEVFYETFKVSRQETEKKRIYELGNKQWDIPALHELLENILPKNIEFHNLEVEQNFPRIGQKKMLLNARRITMDPQGPENIILAIEDVTNR